MVPFRVIPAILLASSLVAGAGTALAADCKQLVDSFTQAVETGQEAEAQGIVDKIATDAECGKFQVQAQRRLAALRLGAAQSLMARGRPVGEYQRLLTDADRLEVLWQAAATLAEVRFGERRFADAAIAFDRAIEIMRNESLTPTAPSKFEVDGLVERSAQSRLLAANLRSGDEGGGFVRTARNQRDGKLGGVYSPSVRGIVPRALPVPITFEYRKATFTSVGEQAARELATAIREQQAQRVVLVGHTDVRGEPEFNVRLSVDRAESVANFLRENGINVPVETIGKGATEPMQLTDTSGLTQDDIYALNRRVEWRRE
jgi:outer membrane protein OmpA-like peptidoglycan-associated protein